MKRREQMKWELCYHRVPIDDALFILHRDKAAGATHATVKASRRELMTNTPSSVGRADSVDSGRDPQGAAAQRAPEVRDLHGEGQK